MISVSDMREMEKKAMEFGVSEAVLMENAGANAAKIVNKKKPLKGKRVLVFCGTGNNAGDGLVFARHALIHGARVEVYLVKNPDAFRTETTRRNYGILHSLKSMGLPVNVHNEKLPKAKADVLVDAMLGTGLKEDVNKEYTKIIKKFNGMEGFKVSLDCPSGIECDTGKVMGCAVRADMTITFHDRKKGLDKGNSGEIVVVDIGIPKMNKLKH